MQAPKRRTSHSKQNMRRSHDALRAVNLGACPQLRRARDCRIASAAIAACYRGREVRRGKGVGR